MKTLRSLCWIPAFALILALGSEAQASEKPSSGPVNRSPAALVSRPELRSRVALEPAWSRDLVTPKKLEISRNLPVQKMGLQRVVTPQSTGFQAGNFHRPSVSGF